jgi:hypothetical protein
MEIMKISEILLLGWQIMTDNFQLFLKRSLLLIILTRRSNSGYYGIFIHVQASH